MSGVRQVRGADVFRPTEGKMVRVVIARHESVPRRRRPWHAQKPLVREPGDLHRCPHQSWPGPRREGRTQSREAVSLAQARIREAVFTREAVPRHHPRWEPGALAAPAGICAGAERNLRPYRDRPLPASSAIGVVRWRRRNGSLFSAVQKVVNGTKRTNELSRRMVALGAWRTLFGTSAHC